MRRATAMRGMLVRSPVLLAGALLILVMLPWLTKPYTTDDPVFLLSAGQALRTPSNPLALDLLWNGSLVPHRMFELVPGGTLFSYVLIPTALAGYREAAAHSTQLILALLGLAATARVGFLLGLDRVQVTAAGALFVTAPALLGITGAVTPDVLAMTTVAWGVERLLVGASDPRRWWAILAAGLLFGLGAHARIPAILVPFAIAVAGTLVQDVAARRRLISTGAVAAGVACLVWFLYGVGVGPKSGSSEAIVDVVGTFLRLWRLPRHVSALSAHLLLTTGFAACWIIGRGRQFRWKCLLAGVPVFAIVTTIAGLPVWAFLVWPGLAALGDLVVEAWQRRTATLLVAAAWVLCCLPPMVYVHFPSKYLVLGLPGLAIAGAVALFPGSSPVRRGRVGGLVATMLAGIVLGSLVLRADAAQAGADREAVSRAVAGADKQPLWFVGQWSLYWYALRGGANPVSSEDPKPSQGDLILVRHTPPNVELDLPVCGARVPGGWEFNSEAGTIRSPHRAIGFFNTGLLPWGSSKGPISRYEVRRVVPCEGTEGALERGNPPSGSGTIAPARRRYVPW